MKTHTHVRQQARTHARTKRHAQRHQGQCLHVWHWLQKWVHSEGDLWLWSYLQLPIPLWFLFKGAQLHFSICRRLSRPCHRCRRLPRPCTRFSFQRCFISTACVSNAFCFSSLCSLNWRRFLSLARFSPPDAIITFSNSRTSWSSGLCCTHRGC